MLRKNLRGSLSDFRRKREDVRQQNQSSLILKKYVRNANVEFLKKEFWLYLWCLLLM